MLNSRKVLVPKPNINPFLLEDQTTDLAALAELKRAQKCLGPPKFTLGDSWTRSPCPAEQPDGSLSLGIWDLKDPYYRSSPAGLGPTIP